MLYSEGSYPNGSVDEKTGVVSLYDSMDAKEPIAQVRAEQPDNVYKQYAMGVATFDNVKLDPKGRTSVVLCTRMQSRVKL